jgi:glycerophosphoryl diester phosphodiesterase
MKKILTIAHRGYSSIAPENTITAFEKALVYNPDIIECDVHRTKDGEIILMHDASVNRTTNGSGNISEMTLSELRDLDAGSWFSEDYKGEKIPLLSEALECTKDRCTLMIELKADNIESQVIDIVNSMGMQEQVCLGSFIKDIGIRIKKLSDIPFMQIISYKSELSEQEMIDLMNLLKSQNAKYLSINYQPVTQELIDRTHDSGFGISVWTIDDKDEILRMAGMNVDVITSNDIKMLKEVLDS